MRAHLPFCIIVLLCTAMAHAQNTPTRINAATSIEEETSEQEDYESLDSLFTLYQPYLANISAYEPVYFLVGTDPKKSKFQMSLKYQFFSKNNPAGAKYPWLQGIHFAYTQTSFWDLGSESAPFEDTSYKPELFYLTGNMRSRLSWLKGFYVQTGLQHESNGRAGDESRGANTIYSRPIFIFYNEGSRLGFMVAPKVWAYFDREQDTNPDLPDYRGYFDLEMVFGWAESVVLGTNLRWASKGPSVELNITYPLHKISFNTLEIYFQAQYFNGYAESLLNYTDHTSALRLGLAIVR